MKVNLLFCICLVLFFAGVTFLVLDVIFEDKPVEVFNESEIAGFGGIGFQIENNSFIGGNESG